MRTITVEIKNVFGVEKYYPRCPHSEKFAKLAGTKTLTPEAIEIIKGMAYSVEVFQPTRTL